MRISLEMPDAVFGKLATVADTRGVKIGELIADAAGKRWRTIAEEIGVDVSTIYGAVRRETGRRLR